MESIFAEQPTPGTKSEYVVPVWLKVIAVLELVGGTFGILLMIYVAFASQFSWQVMIMLPIPIAIFVLSFFAGKELWKGTKFGRRASIAVQLIQLPKISSQYLIFSFSFGFDLFAQITTMNGMLFYGLQFRLLADSQLYIFLQQEPALGLGVSILSIVAIQILRYYGQSGQIDRPEIPSLPPTPDAYADALISKESGATDNDLPRDDVQ